MTASVPQVLRDAADLKPTKPHLLIPQLLGRVSTGRSRVVGDHERISASTAALFALRRYLAVDDVTRWGVRGWIPAPHR